MTDDALRVEHLSKHFGEFAALTDLSLAIAPGEVRGLVGPNGSGKSTLVKILSGYHAPDGDQRVWLWGREVSFPIRNAPAAGIATIHQDLGLWGGATALENFGVTSGYGTGSGGPIRWGAERDRFTALCADLGVRVDPDATLGDLSPAERSFVALVRALRQLREHSGRHLFVLDEPTVTFDRDDVGKLFGVIRQLASQGSSVIFVGHRLAEVLEISDRVSVIRDGRLVATAESASTTPHAVLRLMLGRDAGGYFPERESRPAGEPVLSVEGLRGPPSIDVSFEARAGEILGLTGLAGMGQDELPYLLIGTEPSASGRVRVDGKEIARPQPRNMAAHGAVLVPADRLRYGVWTGATATENTTLPMLSLFFRRLRLDRGGEISQVSGLMRRLAVRPPEVSRQMWKFSGGNQQKLVLGRALMMKPKLLLLHEPTMGVDAGARKEILRMVEDAAGTGCGVIIFSREYEELAAMCDRILVMDSGRIASELPGGATEEEILKACHAA